MGNHFYHQPMGGEGFEWEGLKHNIVARKAKQSLHNSKPSWAKEQQKVEEITTNTTTTSQSIASKRND